jgi:cytosine/adenosine deaminase-related metal-dependent hydrolase
MRQLLEDLSAWNDEWRVPDQTPVGYLASLDLIDSRILLVHGVQFDAESLALLAERDVTIVVCPRSNAHVGEGAPPLQAFYDAGVKVAVGTDSLSSAPDLNVFAELALMRTVAPRVPARQLLASATVRGARALGFGGDFGTIEPGKRAALIEVTVPPGVDDVEEYLVGGAVTPQQIRWVGQRA